MYRGLLYAGGVALLLLHRSAGAPEAQPVAEAKPLVTTPPLAEVVTNRLLGRQEGNVCGYFSGYYDYPLTCAGGYQCGINTYLSAFACCANPADCAYQTSCVNSAQAAACDTCQYDWSVLTCSDAVSSECATIEFSVSNFANPFTDYVCYTSAGVWTAYDSASATQTAGGSSPKSTIGLQGVSQTAASGSGSGNGNSGNGNGNSGTGNGNSGSGNGASYSCSGGNCIINVKNSGDAARVPQPAGALMPALLIAWVLGF